MSVIKCFADEFKCRLEEGAETLPRLKIKASVVLADVDEISSVESDNIKKAIVDACGKYVKQKEGGAK